MKLTKGNQIIKSLPGTGIEPLNPLLIEPLGVLANILFIRPENIYFFYLVYTQNKHKLLG